ncbi:MAG: hypothetical protein ACOVQA_13745, partial [Thermoflexibacteraceae bacterium]
KIRSKIGGSQAEKPQQVENDGNSLLLKDFSILLLLTFHKCTAKQPAPHILWIILRLLSI